MKSYYVVFWFCLLSLRTFFRFIHIVACVSTPLLFTAELHSTYNIPHFVYPFITDVHLVFFHFLAIKNNDALNIPVPVFVGTYVSSGDMSKDGIAGSPDKSMFHI